MTKTMFKTSIAVFITGAMILTLLFFLPAIAFAEEAGGSDFNEDNGLEVGSSCCTADGSVSEPSAEQISLSSSESDTISPPPPESEATSSDLSDPPPAPDDPTHSETEALLESEAPDPDLSDPMPAIDEPVDPETEPMPEEISGDFNLDVAEHSPVEGNSYTAEITYGEQLISAASAGTSSFYNLTFTELSENGQTLGSAKAAFAEGLTVSGTIEQGTKKLAVSSPFTAGAWEAYWEEINDNGIILYYITIRATHNDYLLTGGQSVAVSFYLSAPVTPGDYYIATEAWTDVNMTINNTPHITHNNPHISVCAGTGTEIDPFQIATAGQLNNLRHKVDAHYIQTADIDFSLEDYYYNDNDGWSKWNGGKGWDPISNLAGSYNGNDYTISNLYINRPDESYVGLFSNTFSLVNPIVISHVTLSNVDITGGYCTGGLVGITNSSASLFNCHVDGEVTSEYNIVGGLVGMSSGEIQGCSFNGSVNGAEYVGGLVGQQNSGQTTGCHTTGQVIGTSKVGGLIGINYGTVENCHSSATAEGDQTVGGLVGYNAYPSGSISNSYSTGLVNGTAEVGGLAGINSGSIANCNSSAVVTGISGIDDDAPFYSSFTGGLVGYQNEGLVNDSYATGSVSGYWYVGGFVGSSSSNAEINNCYATGPVTGYWYVGGFVGINSYSSDISYCHAAGPVTGIVGETSGDYIGGFAGTNTGTITGCYSEGAATGNQSIGGFAGSNGGTIAASYASGAASGIYGVGGLIGYAQSGLVIDSYATGNVLSKMAAGGLVGSNQGTLTRCYAIGDVEVVAEAGNANSGKTAGGLVGQSNISGNINNCFSTGNVIFSGTGPSAGQYLGSLVGYNSGAVTNSFAAGLVKEETAPVVDYDEGALVNVGAVDLAELRDITTYQAGSVTGWDWSIAATDITIARGALNPYPYPLLSWEDEGFSGSYTWSINPEKSNGGGNGGGNGGDDNGDGSGDETGNELDDFDWSSGIPTEQTWSGGNTPGWARILLFRGRSGPRSVFSADAIISGSSSDLLKAVTAYNYALQNFEENKSSMTEAEYAVAVIELAVARAAILVMEARLSGGAAALAEAIEAYAFALAQLSNYGSFLDSSQGDVVSSLMNAIESTISVLSV